MVVGSASSSESWVMVRSAVAAVVSSGFSGSSSASFSLARSSPSDSPGASLLSTLRRLMGD